MRQGAQGQCTEMPLRDVMQKKVGGGFRMGDICTPMAVSCQCMAKTTTILGLAWWPDGKASVYNAGDLGSIPGLERSPGKGNGSPLQYDCLENPMDRGAW